MASTFVFAVVVVCINFWFVLHFSNLHLKVWLNLKKKDYIIILDFIVISYRGLVNTRTTYFFQFSFPTDKP
jgi:hypothetical protein